MCLFEVIFYWLTIVYNSSLATKTMFKLRQQAVAATIFKFLYLGKEDCYIILPNENMGTVYTFKLTEQCKLPSLVSPFVSNLFFLSHIGGSKKHS